MNIFLLDTLVLPVEVIRESKPKKFYMSDNDLWKYWKDTFYYSHCPYCDKQLDRWINIDASKHLICNGCNTYFYIRYLGFNLNSWYIEFIKVY